MTIFPTSLLRAFSSIKGYLRAVFVGVLMNLALPFLGAQPEPLSKDTKQTIETIAKYASSDYDRLSYHLYEIGYTPPVHLIPDWEKWPAVYRIETAYRDYEHHLPGSGGRFLALLASHLAQTYSPLSTETPLKWHLDEGKRIKGSGEIQLPKIDRKLESSTPEVFNEAIAKVHISEVVKAAIFTISKYAESGPCGGIHFLLSNICNLENDYVYDILSRQITKEAALLEGVKIASVKEPVEKLVTKMADHVRSFYGPAHGEATLVKFKSQETASIAVSRRVFSEQDKVAIKTISEHAGEGKGGGSLHNLLSEIMGMDNNAVEEILRSQSTKEAALLEGLKKASAIRPTEELMVKMAVHVCRHHPAANGEPSLTPYKLKYAPKFHDSPSGKGFNIDPSFVEYPIRDTPRKVEIVPDFDLNSVQVIIDPSLKEKELSPVLLREFALKISELYDEDGLLRTGRNFNTLAVQVESFIRAKVFEAPSKPIGSFQEQEGIPERD